MNIVCILASGVGNRFGSAIPKQYHLVNGRPVIEYTINAALNSVADEVIVVANHPYMEELENKYSVVCVNGGKERNLSLINALNYIKAHYSCEKIIVIDAVCPLVTSALMNQYLEYLEEYDAVFTTSKIPTSLARYSGGIVHREEYVLIQSPDAYRFELIYSSFNESTVMTTTPLHSLPIESKIKFHFGFKNYAKIIYPHDIAVIEALLNEQAKTKRLETHKNDISLSYFQRLRLIDNEGTKQWEKVVDRQIEELFERWGVYEFNLNESGYTALVIEAQSHVYGDVVIKIYPPFLKHRFIKEITVLKGVKNYQQCVVYDIVLDENAMLLERIIPGDYIDFNEDKDLIRKLFVNMEMNKVTTLQIEGSQCLKGIVELAEEEYKRAKEYHYHHSDRLDCLMDKMQEVYQKYFDSSECYVLHGDVYFRNALRGGADKIITIDPVGYNAPFIFEYMPFLTYELLWHSDKKCVEKYNELIEFFGGFADVKQFYPATFVFLVKQLMPSIYEANDGFKRADSYMELITILFAGENRKDL